VSQDLPSDHDMLRELHQYVLGPDGLRDRFKTLEGRVGTIESALVGSMKSPGIITRVNAHLSEHRRRDKRNFALLTVTITALVSAIREFLRWTKILP